MTTAYLNRTATAVPEHYVLDAFFAERMLADPRLRTFFRRLVSSADIAHRYWFFDPQKGAGQFSSHNATEFYRLGSFPNTARRMECLSGAQAAEKVVCGAVKARSMLVVGGGPAAPWLVREGVDCGELLSLSLNAVPGSGNAVISIRSIISAQLIASNHLRGE